MQIAAKSPSRGTSGAELGIRRDTSDTVNTAMSIYRLLGFPAHAEMYRCRYQPVGSLEWSADTNRRGASKWHGPSISRFAAVECFLVHQPFRGHAGVYAESHRQSESMADVSILPDENLGRGVPVGSGGRAAADQPEEGPGPGLQVVCRGALECVTRLALERAVADRGALLEPPHDLVIEAPHVDGRYPVGGVSLIHPVYLAQHFADAESRRSQ